MEKITQYHFATVSTLGLIGSCYIYYRFKEKLKKRTDLETKWIEIGHIKRINVYPVKSCAPILLNQADCFTTGLRNGWICDRALMIVEEEDNNIATTELYPELLKVKTSCKGAVLKLEHPDMAAIEINLAEVLVTQKPQHMTIGNQTTAVYDCGHGINEWFTKCLNQEGRKFRLIYYGLTRIDQPLGLAQILKKYIKYTKEETFYNIINESSIDELNTRLKTSQVSEANFRPTFLVSGAKPYDEDNWKYIRVGENVFEVVKPCTRCILGDIDPETGIRVTNNEPLDLLKSYRPAHDPGVQQPTGDLPRMGLHLILRSVPGGTISLNNPVYVAY